MTGVSTAAEPAFVRGTCVSRARPKGVTGHRQKQKLPFRELFFCRWKNANDLASDEDQPARKQAHRAAGERPKRGSAHA